MTGNRTAPIHIDVPAPERDFKSDICAPVLPEVMDAIAFVNDGHAPGHGHDALTARVADRLRSVFDVDGDVLLCFGGTGANVLGLATVLNGSGAVVCSEHAHILLDEVGASERILGVQLQPVWAPDGKVTTVGLEPAFARLGDHNAAQPAVLSLTNATELGTCYTIDELTELCALAHDHGLRVHLDGARLANALVGTGSRPADVFEAGVDVLSFGGTKNGLMGAEAVITAARDPRAPYLHKAVGQLPSKQRFLAAQFDAWLEGDLWLATAERANRTARTLTERLAELGVEPAWSPDANIVFARFPRAAADAIAAWTPVSRGDDPNVVRFVCSFDTTDRDVEDLVAGIERVL